MKKTLLIGAGIIVLAAVVTPKFVANSFDQKLDSVVALIDQNPAYSVSIKERTSGWFSSMATINIGLDTSAFAQENTPELQDVFKDMNVDVVIDAQHGPILTQNGISLGWLTWNAKVDGNSFRDTLEFPINSPFYQMTAHTNLSGSSTLSDSIPSFTLKDKEAFSQFSFSGWNGSGSYSNSEVSYQGVLETITADSAFGKFGLNQWRVDSTIQSDLMHAMGGNFYDSTMTMQIQDITFEQVSDQAKTTLTEFKVDGISDFDKTTSLMDTQFNFYLKELASDGFNLSSVVVNTEVNNLHEQFFKAYQTLMSEIGKEPEKTQENINTFMQAELLGQLKAEPELNISSFEAKINQGNITGSLSSKIQNVTTLPDAIESPVFWLQHIIANGQINADQSAALWLAADTIKTQIKADPSAAQMTEDEINAIAQQQAIPMLQGMQQQGLFTETTTGYEMVFSLKDGQALLNGNPMPLPISQ